jgi:glycosyltransferase involved in cell wall biosynthesis
LLQSGTAEEPAGAHTRARLPARPSVDVVVPFVGPRESLERLIAGLGDLQLRDGDTLTVVDNRPRAAAEVRGRAGVRVVRAPERQSSYYARNVGAAAGDAEWILFVDADVAVSPQLLDRYFDQAPADATGVMAGGIEDEPCGPDASVAARFASLAAAMSQSNTLRTGRFAYAQTANCAIRRAAFEAVGGFEDDIRSGGDADICFRLRAAGWDIEERRQATVTHSSRQRLGKLLRQRARMGGGAAWVNSRHPGSFPSRRPLGLAAWVGKSFARACISALRGRRDEWILGVLDPLTVCAFELGRLLPNSVGGRGVALCRPSGSRTLPVTVVIPAHNRERMVARALDSVLAQTSRPAEIVVVDDASTDRTAAVAEERGARVIRRERNGGEGAARNSGLAAASQPWVALLDSDDEWLPGHLEALWRGRGDHVLVATSCIRCGEDPRVDRFHGAATGRDLVVRSPSDIVFPENPVPVSALMVRRDVALAVGGYRKLRHCSDFDFLLRCLEAGSGVVLPEVGMLYHLHADQVSREREAMKEAHAEIAASYSDRDWFDAHQLGRWRAVVAWDMFRLEGGIRRAAALLRPAAPPALVRLWIWRWKVRRRSRLVAADARASAHERHPR